MRHTKQKQCILTLFFCRVKSYIRNGWANNITNPDLVPQTLPSSSDSAQMPPSEDIIWKDIRKVFSDKKDVPMFTNGQLINYFVCRTVADGLPAGDFKSMNKSAKYLYECGHVQNIQIGTSTSHMSVKANCLPEMKKDHVYKVLISLDTTSWDIVAAECGCPAGKGPNASCKHVGATCYALVEFCKSGQLPDFLTGTQRLQEWNKPRPRKIDPIPVLGKSFFVQKKSTSNTDAV